MLHFKIKFPHPIYTVIYKSQFHYVLTKVFSFIPLLHVQTIIKYMSIIFYLLFSSVLAVCKNTNGLLLPFMLGPLSNVKTHDTRFIIWNQFSCLVIQLKYRLLWISQKIICILVSFKLQVLCQKYYPCNPSYPHLRSISVSTDTQPCHAKT